ASIITVSYALRKPIAQEKWASRTETSIMATVTRVETITRTKAPITMTWTETETFRAPRETVYVEVEEKTETVVPVQVTSYQKVEDRAYTRISTREREMAEAMATQD